MHKGDTYTILFATVICVACSILLSATSASLKKKQDLQVELDRKINVLKALGVQVVNGGVKIADSDITKLFQEHITEIVLDPQTGQVIPNLTSGQLSKDDIEKKRKLPLYLWKDGGEVTKYALPISGKGLWSTIYGYLALDKDLSTIVGVTFYRHGETPGLGADVAADWFQDQFKGKKVFKDGKLQKIEVTKGAAKNRYPSGSDHAVDGIAGATLTGNGVNHFLNGDLEMYEKYFRGIRKS